MNNCLKALNRDYGIQCRNAFDLRELVVTVKQDKKQTNEKFKIFGLQYLTNLFTPGKELFLYVLKGPAAPLGSWGATMLSLQQIEAATRDAYLCCLVAYFSC